MKPRVLKPYLEDSFVQYENSVSVTLVPRPQGVIVYSNPPTFFWPSSKNDETRYTIQYSKAKDFRDGPTATKRSHDLTFYRPSHFLSLGKWYWRYRAEGHVFSDTYEFYIGGQTVKDEIITTFSTLREAMERVPKTHPRLWIFKEDLQRIRKENARKERSQQILNFWECTARKHIGEELRDDVPPEPKIHKEEDAQIQITTWNRWNSKELAGETMMPAGSLAELYLITGDKAYAEEAKRRALHAVEWDPEGFTSYAISDFANQYIAENLAIVYDYLYDYLTEDERSKIRDVIETRTRVIYEIYRKSFMTYRNIFNAHAWQTGLQGFGICSLALMGDVEEAAEWFEYFLKLCVWLYPPWGNADGGWYTMTYFEGTVMLNSLITADLVRKATGIDLYKKPWYKNLPYFLIYSHPPRTYSPHFGDEGPRLPARKHSVVMRKLAQELRNPYAMWYAEEVEKDHKEPESLRGPIWGTFFEYLWSLDESCESRAPTDLPLARCFRGIDWALMHTNLTAPEENVSLAFKSSPYGDLGHGHSDQNTFNMRVCGHPVTVDSGYRVAGGGRHVKGWYRRTKAHNTILIDGKGQKERKSFRLTEPLGYGTIEKFLFTKDYDYTVGDASHAYVDDAGLKKFRRHVIFLRPDVYVIFDELEAEHQAIWQWLLHSNNKMRIIEERNEVLLNEKTADLRVSINSWSSTVLNFILADEFDVPAIDWSGQFGREDRGYWDLWGQKTPPNQWHLNVSTRDKLEEEYFLAVLQPRKKKELRSFYEIEWVKTDEVFGFTTQRGGRQETVLFNIGGRGVKIGDLETDSFMLAFSTENDAPKSFLISNATKLEYRGKAVFSSHKPACASILLSSPE